MRYTMYMNSSRQYDIDTNAFCLLIVNCLHVIYTESQIGK